MPIRGKHADGLGEVFPRPLALSPRLEQTGAAHVGAGQFGFAPISCRIPHTIQNFSLGRILRVALGAVRHGDPTRGRGVGQASRRTQVSTRYRFASVSSTVRSLRAHAWHDRNQPAALSPSGRTAVEQRPWST